MGPLPVLTAVVLLVLALTVGGLVEGEHYPAAALVGIAFGLLVVRVLRAQERRP